MLYPWSIRLLIVRTALALALLGVLQLLGVEVHPNALRYDGLVAAAFTESHWDARTRLGAVLPMERLGRARLDRLWVGGFSGAALRIRGLGVLTVGVEGFDDPDAMGVPPRRAVTGQLGLPRGRWDSAVILGCFDGELDPRTGAYALGVPEVSAQGDSSCGWEPALEAGGVRVYGAPRRHDTSVIDFLARRYRVALASGWLEVDREGRPLPGDAVLDGQRLVSVDGLPFAGQTVEVQVNLLQSLVAHVAADDARPFTTSSADH